MNFYLVSSLMTFIGSGLMCKSLMHFDFVFGIR
jgi:hypothetical protein